MSIITSPNVSERNLQFCSFDVSLCSYSLHGFGSILEILITAQIICIVSNGPL